MSIFKNRTVIGVICILLALVICFGITPLFNQSISQKAEIVRVTKDIHAGELITRDMVTTAEVRWQSAHFSFSRQFQIKLPRWFLPLTKQTHPRRKLLTPHR